ncbi:MAG: hypothetical protein ACM3NT_11125, partial [Methylocystaceae bacterium]
SKLSFNTLASINNQVITPVSLTLLNCVKAGAITDLQAANYYFIAEYPEAPENNCIVISLTQAQADALMGAYSSLSHMFIMGSSGWATIQSSSAPELLIPFMLLT